MHFEKSVILGDDICKKTRGVARIFTSIVFVHLSQSLLMTSCLNESLVSYWSLNTTNNCELLERHVTKEIYEFVKLHEFQVAQSAPHEYELNVELLHDKQKLQSYKKVKKDFYTSVLLICKIILITIVKRFCNWRIWVYATKQ